MREVRGQRRRGKIDLPLARDAGKIMAHESDEATAEISPQEMFSAVVAEMKVSM